MLTTEPGSPTSWMLWARMVSPSGSSLSPRLQRTLPGPRRDKFNVCSNAWINKHKKVQEKKDQKEKGAKGRGRKRKIAVEADGDSAPPPLISSKVTKTKSGRKTAANFID